MTRRYWLAAGTLVQREMVRFLRQKNRLIGALATPILFWFFLGSGLGRSFQLPGSVPGSEINYLQFFLPGTLTLMCLFTAIFSTISVIEDRQAGFLQGVLVSPAPRGSIVMGKLAGGTCLSLLQGAVFVAIFPLVKVPLSFKALAWTVVLMGFLSFGLTGLGLLVAWATDSIQGFHAVMNLLLMPLWFLSGAVFPASGAPEWLRVVIALNPVTYGVAGLHRAFLGGDGPSLAVCGTVTAGFAVAMFALAQMRVRREK